MTRLSNPCCLAATSSFASAAFFANYEGTQNPSLGSSSVNVPTIAKRGGDFSEDCRRTGQSDHDL
jgi:hypothetical protein